jgi:hypothetical protein
LDWNQSPQELEAAPRQYRPLSPLEVGFGLGRTKKKKKTGSKQSNR